MLGLCRACNGLLGPFEEDLVLGAGMGRWGVELFAECISFLAKYPLVN